MHSKDKGDIAEYKVITKFLERGWIVSKTIGDNNQYDLIVDRDNKPERVQVKTGHIIGNIVKVKLKSSGYHIKDGAAIHFTNTYDPYDVELFAAYCPESDKVYLIPNDRVMYDVNLRLTESTANNGKPIRYAKDFEV